MKNGKKGVLIQTYIIYGVLAVIGFVAVLAWMSGLDFEDDADFTSCHLSVLQRAAFAERGLADAQGFIPLKCKVDKVCLGGDCEDSFAGEEFRSVRISEDDKAEAIEKHSAEAMHRCWEMMGKGELDIYESYLKRRGIGGDGTAKPICVICSRLAIDDSIADSLEDVDIYDYMENNRPAGSRETYLETFTDEDVGVYPEVSRTVFETSFDENAVDVDTEFQDGNGRQVAFVFMQIKSDSIVGALGRLGRDAVVAGGATFMTAKSVSPGALALGKFGPYIAAVGGGLAAQSALNSYAGQIMAAGYCGSFAGQEKGREGCSLVQAVPYNFNSINNLCHEIEGLQ